MKTLLCLLLVLVMVFAFSSAVVAQHRGGGHWGWGGRGYWGGYGWWGYPYWWDYPYYPYYYPYSYPYYDPYYYGGYGEPPVPPQGVTPPAESGQQQPSYWYFCQNPEGYYPYVKECPGGWMKVVPPKPNAAPPPTLGAPVPPVSPSGKKPEK
jgi:hypothetical protein